MDDYKGGLLTFALNAEALSTVRKVPADSGNIGERFKQDVLQILGATVEVAECNELHKFFVIHP